MPQNYAPKKFGKKKRGRRKTVPAVLKRFREGATTVGSAIGTGYAIAKIAKKAWTGVQAIKKLINVERNYLEIDTNVANTAFDSNGSVVCLSLMATGDGVGARTGNSIRTQSIDFSSVITAGTTNIQNSMYRVIIFIDKENDGAAPNVNDVLIGQQPHYLYNPLTVPKRFQIIKDWLGLLQPKYSTNVDYKLLNFSTDLTGHCLYDATSSSQSSTREGAIFMLTLSDRTAGSDAPIMNYKYRLVYTDN